MIALSKLVPDEEEVAMVHRQLSNYTLNTGPFGSMHAIRYREDFSSLEWWNMHGGATPLLQTLALQVLSQVVNTSLQRGVRGLILSSTVLKGTG